MKRWTFVFSICALVVSLAMAVPSAMAYSLVIGAPGDANTGNCFPFGCSGGSRYQQVYNAALFTGGPISITNISFYNTQYDAGNAVIATGTYQFHLSTTSAAVNGLDTVNLSNNVGADDQVFFSGTLGGPIGGTTWTIPGTAFNYNPGMGNLLLDIFVSGASGGNAYLDAHNGTFGNDSSRAHNFGSAFEEWGLVTGFNAATAPVPIPGAILLFAPALAGLAAVRRRFTK